MTPPRLLVVQLEMDPAGVLTPIACVLEIDGVRHLLTSDGPGVDLGEPPEPEDSAGDCARPGAN